MPTTAGIITTATVIGTIGEIKSPEHHFRAFRALPHIQAAAARRIKKVFSQKSLRNADRLKGVALALSESC